MAKLTLILTGFLAALTYVAAAPKKAPKGYVSSQSFTAKRMTLWTPQDYNTTNTLLQKALLYENYNPCYLYGAAQPGAIEGITTLNKTEYIDNVNTLIGPYDLMPFYSINFTPYLHLYFDPDSLPTVATYLIGNPLIAETMFQEDWITGLHVPTRLVMWSAIPPAVGTTIVWDLPSSLIAIGALANKTSEATLKSLAVGLDGHLEAMLRNVTGLPAA